MFSMSTPFALSYNNPYFFSIVGMIFTKVFFLFHNPIVKTKETKYLEHFSNLFVIRNTISILSNQFETQMRVNRHQSPKNNFYHTKNIIQVKYEYYFSFLLTYCVLQTNFSFQIQFFLECPITNFPQLMLHMSCQIPRLSCTESFFIHTMKITD